MPTSAEQNINGLPVSTADGHAVVYLADGSTAVIDLRPYKYGQREIKAISSTSYALIASDVGKTLVHTSGSDSTININLDAALTWPIGAPVEIQRNGAGALEVTVTGGVTLRAAGKTKGNVTGSVFTLRKVAANTWNMFGDTKA